MGHGQDRTKRSTTLWFLRLCGILGARTCAIGEVRESLSSLVMFSFFFSYIFHVFHYFSLFAFRDLRNQNTMVEIMQSLDIHSSL